MDGRKPETDGIETPGEKCLAAGMDDDVSNSVRLAELQATLEWWHADHGSAG